MHRIPRLVALVGLAALASPGAAQTTSDPFVSGMRWSEGSPVSQPWIPRRVCFAGHGQAVWAGRAVGNPGLSLYTGTDAASLASALDVPLAGAIGTVEVAAGEGLGELYSAAQYPAPGGGRITEVTRTTATQTPSAAWGRTLAPNVMGGVKLAAGGGALYVARHDLAAARVWLDRLDPADGHSLFSVPMPAVGLRGLKVSSDGGRVALALGDSVRVFDGAGTSLASFPLATSSEAFAFSADGSALAMGDVGLLHLWRDTGSGFLPAGSVITGGAWLATRAAFSDDGWTLGVGWWDAQSGLSVRFQMWDLAASVKLQDIQQSGVYSNLQNFPEAVDLTPDGQRMVIGTWGSGGPDPQLMLFDRALAQPVYSTYLSGSVMALDLDDTGTRIAVATKAGHANQFSTTGYVQLFDTGERDLQLKGSIKTGTSFQLASQLAGSTLSLFVFGEPLDPPAPLFGVLGFTHIDPAQPYTVLGTPATLTGRADLNVMVPPSPALIGYELGAQAVFLGVQGLEFSSQAPLLTVL